jgi:LmbE family N-acetylglucosaminyl deacetylase
LFHGSRVLNAGRYISRELIAMLPVFAVGFAVLLIMMLPSRSRIARSWQRPVQLRRLAIALSVPLLAIDLGLIAYGSAGQSADYLPVTTLNVAAVIGLAVWAATSRITVSSMRLPRRILAVGAHPDDIELACGATLAKFVDSGHEVHALVMTHGSTGGDELTRVAEANAGSQFLGLTALIVMNFPDSRLPDYGKEMIDAIETVLLRLNPDIILTHSAHDRHQDHHAVHMATVRAARTHPAVLGYESPSVTDEFVPRFYVDIDRYVDAKIESVHIHQSQRDRPYVGPEQIKALSLFRGRQGAVKNAEAFETVRMLDSRLRDL